MKSLPTLSFILAVILYSLILAVGYWLWTLTPLKENINPKLSQVPVTLAMFTEPTIKEKPPIETPVPEPVAEPVKKEIKQEIKEPEIKPVVEEVKPEPEPKPKSEPKPIPKPIPKPVKKPVKELKKVEPKTQPPKQIEKDVAKIEPHKPVAKAQKPKPIAKPKPAYNPQQVANAEQVYLNDLRQKIMAYAQDTYPKRAKRRQWQGDVIIEFKLLPSGKITGLTIIESSGRSILDQAALEIFQVKMAHYFKPFPKEVNRKTWFIKVPVSYHLE